ncbi:peroxidase-like [Rhopalosiphum maidis]|uniref:peroxidase-like n=1 Tax=Rhopalosiphum maidis TaxID=43146 RepID=UPI000EFE57D1|nr:peroxidase-like [Rhopalosiphum maidis]
MKTIEIINLVLFVGVSHGLHQNVENSHYTDYKNRISKGARCKYATNDVHENDNIQDTRTYNFIISDLLTNNSDPNPSTIPSLMKEPESTGLLSPDDINLADKCFSKPDCDIEYRFRTMDGSCNNLDNPVWGQANTANIRIIQANYSDNNSEIRKAKSGNELPNVRHIRTTAFIDKDFPAPRHNSLMMQFGQIITHDTALLLSKTTLDDSSPLECCNPDGTTPENLPKQCLNITIPEDDSGSKKRCLSIARTADTSDLGCAIKPVRQQTGASSFLDTSLLYGPDNDTAMFLRKLTDGELKYQLGPKDQVFLPNVENSTQFCNVNNETAVCYFTGDPRVNQLPDLAVETTSFLRLHNYLCKELKDMNPSWDDECIYQNARRIVIAMYQHVTYNEYVPELLGKEFAKANKLLPLTEGFDYNYNKSINPTTITSFTAAAFRSQHSYIQGRRNLVDESGNVTSKILLRNYYFIPEIVQMKDNYDHLSRGLLTQNAQDQDQFFTEEVSEFAFRTPNEKNRLDLVSVDMERGRDYGVPPYNKFRKLCGLSEAKTFEDLTDQISKKKVNTLIELYEDVDDVDYYVAGLLENRKPGSVLGHTFQCIVGEMFYRWKFGDRFYYEFGNQTGSFNLDQLNEIRKTTMAYIMCITTNISNVQRNAFVVPNKKKNPLVPCDLIPKPDFSVWKEK